MPIILAIESSCDDTSAAVLKDREVLTNLVAGQDVHKAFGGVVPELASRSHQKNIVPVVDQALKQAGVQPQELDAIAFTRGPGLLGSLLVGGSFAKSMAQSLGIPLIGVNHMQGHILAHFIRDGEDPQFPFLCLTVSGGHTQLVIVRDYFDMEVVGQTIDDAAGEAFDKAAKMLGLEYPGGPLIDKHAVNGDPLRFSFPRPKASGLDFSFSGLKTSILYFLRKEVQKDPGFIENNLSDLCASIQHTVVDILLRRVEEAMTQYGIDTIAIAGGVSANSRLRTQLQEASESKGWKVFIPKFEYCTDNAAMIGITGHYKFLAGEFDEMNATPVARWSI